MTATDAERRLTDRRTLSRLAASRWRRAQDGLPAERRHPLYALLEFPASEPGIEAFLDGVETVANVSLVGAGSRAKRLTSSDHAAYWSALDELSIACRLQACGLDVEFARVPDLIVGRPEEILFLEFTAPHRTTALLALQEHIAGAWAWPIFVTLHLGHITWRPSTRQIGRVLDALDRAAASTPVPEQVDLTAIVSPTILRATFDTAIGPGVASVTDALFGGYNPIADIERCSGRSTASLCLSTSTTPAGPFAPAGLRLLPARQRRTSRSTTTPQASSGSSDRSPAGRRCSRAGSRTRRSRVRLPARSSISCRVLAPPRRARIRSRGCVHVKVTWAPRDRAPPPWPPARHERADRPARAPRRKRVPWRVTAGMPPVDRVVDANTSGASTQAA